MIYPSTAIVILLALIPLTLGLITPLTARDGINDLQIKRGAPGPDTRVVSLSIKGIPGTAVINPDPKVIKILIKNRDGVMDVPQSLPYNIDILKADHVIKKGKKLNAKAKIDTFQLYRGDVGVDCTVYMNEKLPWSEDVTQNLAAFTFEAEAAFACNPPGPESRDWAIVQCALIKKKKQTVCDKLAWPAKKA